MKRLASVLLMLLAVLSFAASDAYLRRFDQAWRLVKEFYYDLDYRGVDWDAVGRAYRQKVAAAASWREVYELLDEMYAELGDDHSRVIPPPEARQALRGALCYPLPFPAPPEDLSAEEEEWNSEAGGDDADYDWGSFEYALKGNVGYLKLPNLVDDGMAGDLESAVRSLEEQGVSGYVLDLRGNPGGMALTMARVAGVFMRGVPWRIVTRTKGVIPQPTIPFWGAPLTKKPLVVLIDGGVNSAAEGLAGALKQSGRATLVGERTAGNTEVLLPYCFPDGGVAMLASGVLAPFKGPTWEGRGVEPDIPVAGKDLQLERAIRLIEESGR
ncbi:S41 family peptidase [Oceanithermus sp.]